MALPEPTGKVARTAQVQYDSTDEFIRAFVNDELVIYDNSSALFVPERLIAGGTGVRTRFNPQIGEGTADVFRPFPGILMLIVESSAHDAEARNALIAESAHSMDKFFYCILVDRGPMTLRFGDRLHEVENGAGVFFKYQSETVIEPFARLSDRSRFVHIFMTQDGIVNASGRLGIAIPNTMNILKRDKPQSECFFPLWTSAALSSFIRSLVEPSVPSRLRNAYLRAKFGELLCHLSGDNEPQLPDRDDVHFFEIVRLEKAKQYLEENIASEKDIGQLAKSVGLNRSRLSTSFKTRYGMPLREYRLELRLAKAFALLSQTTASIENISKQCGYKNVGNFSRAFKNRFGHSPSQLRRF